MPDTQQPAKTEPAAEPKVEPVVKTEPKVEPKPGEPKPGEPPKEPPKGEPPKVDLMSQKLEGENIPEKYRGKTVAEFFTSMAELEGRATKSEQENAQWLAHFQGRAAAPKDYGVTEPAPAPGGAVDPRQVWDKIVETLGEEETQAVLAVLNLSSAPIVTQLSAITREIAKAQRGDWDKYERRIDEIYGNLHPEQRFHPEYGYTFAYNMAKAEAMGTEKPPLPGTPTHVDSGAPSDKKEPPPLTEEQDYWRRKMNMTVEQYRKYSTPSINVGGEEKT